MTTARGQCVNLTSHRPHKPSPALAVRHSRCDQLALSPVCGGGLTPRATQPPLATVNGRRQAPPTSQRMRGLSLQRKRSREL
jgi:hypothetical protein